MTKESIWYIGFECFFEVEVDDIDTAQYWLDYYNKKLDYPACALHEGDKHQIYVSRVKRQR
jgi:hypothetical protein